MEARFCWWSGGMPTVWSGGGDCGAFCHRVRGAGGGEGAVWSNPGAWEEALEPWRRYCSSEGGHMRRWREASRCWRRCGEPGEGEKWTDKCRDLHIYSVDA